jgi:hypothetical protein
MLLSPYEFLEGVTLECPSIHLDGTLEEMKVNHLLAIFVYFKAACFAGVLLSCSKYMQPQATRISRLYNSESGAVFALKGIFKDAPFRFISTVFSLSVLLFTFVFRVSEAGAYASSSTGTIYSNMAWMTVMTMTTLGYGDYVPQTMVGRGIGSACAIWGALIVSVMVVVLTSAFAMDRSTFTLS